MIDNRVSNKNSKIILFFFFSAEMSQDNQHGKWTVSSSDDDDDDDLSSSKPAVSAPPTRDSNHNTTRPVHPVSAQSSQQTHHAPPAPATAAAVKDEPAGVKDEEDLKPVVSSAPSALVNVSEARHAAHSSQLNPVKYESPLAGKRKKEQQEESGWALSDSDDDDGGGVVDDGANKANNAPSRRAPSPKAKKAKVEKNERPPSPYGRLYYIDEPDDFFETDVPCLNDTYRLYLNKVTGLDRKYNTGALHIRGERFGGVVWFR